MSAPLRLVPGGRFVPHGEAVDPDILAFDHWQTELRGLRPNTVRTRHDVLHRLSTLLGKPLREVTEDDLLLWERVHVAGRAPESRRAYVSHVRMFFQYAVKVGIVATDPTGRLTIAKLVRGLPRPVPDEDLRRVVALARPKMRLQLLLGAFCGLRCQETAGLHWSDLHTDGDQLMLLVREGKGGKERVVPVPGVVLEAMVAYGRRRSGPMFYGLDGAQQQPRSVSSSLSRFFRRNGLDYTAHQLRHRFATSAYQLTKDLRLTQELLGHASPQTTSRYAAYDASQTADMVEAMDAAWRKEQDSGEAVSEEELAAVAELLEPDSERDAVERPPRTVRLPRGYPPPPAPLHRTARG